MDKVDKVSINFVGDTSITGIFANKVMRNEPIFDDQLKKILFSTDFNVCNLEGPATNRDNYLRKDIKVVSPPAGITFLADAGFTVFNLANNHSFDCGVDGFLDTRSALENNGLKHFGAGQDISEASKVLYLEKNEIRFSLIGVCHHEGLIAGEKEPGIFCEESESLLYDRISEAKQNSDWVILNYHGGEEYTMVPMPRRRRFIRRLAEKFDVDLIIAHHSHVFQGIESVGKKRIFYSLGNFIFDIDAHRNFDLTRRSALIQFNFYKDHYDYAIFPTVINLNDGLVSRGEDHFIEHVDSISRFDNYSSMWIADAHRVFFGNKQQAYETSEQKHVGTSNLSLVRKLFTWRCYKSLVAVMRDNDIRPVFLGALQFKFKKGLKGLP